MQKSYFFCGVGGSGMSALASLLLARGHRVSGSDRSHDNGQTTDKFSQLEQSGIELFSQNGSGLNEGVDTLVVSAAIEETIPDIKAARELNIPIIKRAELLAELFNQSKGIAIGGTSGKTTVTGMVGWILSEAGHDPSIVNGGLMPNFEDQTAGLANMVAGNGDLFIIEADESDGSIALYESEIAVLNNVSEDHKSLSELLVLFEGFVSRARKGAVINLDDPQSQAFIGTNPNTLTFSLTNQEANLYATNINPGPDGICFTLNVSDEIYDVRLAVPGRHNVANALAALATVSLLDVPLSQAVEAVKGFKGIRRRLEIIGTVGGITVIDDFAHNPDKITATLQTLREFPGRLWVMFQPHGFGPMKRMRTALVDVFASEMGDDDVLLMPEIFYAGGTADKTISSLDIIQDIQERGRNAHFFETRDEIAPFLKDNLQPGDRVIVMGARDDTLTDFARQILALNFEEAAA